MQSVWYFPVSWWLLGWYYCPDISSGIQDSSGVPSLVSCTGITPVLLFFFSWHSGCPWFCCCSVTAALQSRPLLRQCTSRTFTFCLVYLLPTTKSLSLYLSIKTREMEDGNLGHRGWRATNSPFLIARVSESVSLWVQTKKDHHTGSPSLLLPVRLSVFWVPSDSLWTFYQLVAGSTSWPWLNKCKLGVHSVKN